jgi:TolA-binding protein
MYLQGVAYYRMRQYPSAFPVLRKITTNFPNTVWANQAYYYIGMCHYVQRNWKNAIDALRMVGTFVDPESPTVDLVEAGRRFYIRVQDADLPVLHRLGREIHVTVETSSGDKERVRLIPLSERAAVFIGSISTEVGPAKPGDDTLQIVGGDRITTTYVDENTKDGQADVPRTMTTRVVSTASMRFTLGTFESDAVAAFQNQPLFIELLDVDQDISPEADKVNIRVVSRYKMTELEMDELGIPDDQRDGELAFRVRDEVSVTLVEANGEQAGAGPVHTGRFRGKVAIVAHQEDQTVDNTDDLLSCMIGDEVVATYVDELHIDGDSPRQVVVRTRVAGEIESDPRATQSVVYDPILRAKKFNVEATAFLELARIFRSMGLRDGSRLQADEGLERVDAVIRISEPIPSELTQEAYKLKWDMHIVQEDYAKAIATCRLFNEKYPDSPFVDQALMGIARIKYEQEAHQEAINIYRQVLQLENSTAKAEAQFMIAQATEQMSMAAARARGSTQVTERDIEAAALERAVPAYRECAERYPDSAYAGESLAKLVDYYINTRDYAQADDLLEQIFNSYPDAGFLDRLLLKWVQVAYRQGNIQKAHEKCQRLIFDYPESPYAGPARGLLQQIEQRLKG